MTELTLNRSRLGVRFADSDDDPALVTVRSGPYRFRLPMVNCTVGQIRTRIRDRFDLAPQSQAFVAGQAVGDQAVVQPRQSVMFMNRAGMKG